MKSTPSARWAFFSYGHNLGDFTRALETAIGMQKTGAEVRFFNHGGIHNHYIAKAGLAFTDLEPELSWEQHERIMDINRYRVPLGTPIPISQSEWEAMVESDLEAFSSYQPDGVYAGLNLSCMISVPYAKLPMVTQVPTVNCPAFIENELYNMPNTMERNLLMRHLLPAAIKRKIMRRVLLGQSAKASLTSFNAVRVKFGLKPIYNIVDLVRGDLTLLPDLPEMSGLAEEKLSPGYRYTGPIFAKLDLPIPEEVKRVYSQKGLRVFCSLGSSGFPETLRMIVQTLKAIPGVNLVVAATTVLDPDELGPNTDHFFATRMLPAHLVNEMADVAVIHGGQGTVQTAVWAGTPVVGIGFQGEQQANLDGIASAGMAIRIPLWAVNPKSLKKALLKIQNPAFRVAARTLQKRVRQTDGVKASVEAMNQLIHR